MMNERLVNRGLLILCWATVCLWAGGCAGVPQMMAQMMPLPQPSTTPFRPATLVPTPSFLATAIDTPPVLPTGHLIATFFPETPFPSSTPSLSAEATQPSATPTPTSTWAWNPAGSVIAPILVYHHVVQGEPQNLYSVSIEIFREQMDLLDRFGYTAIPISLLVKSLRDGAELPPRPVVLTFDDGNRDIYEFAFPILQEKGFVATIYLVGDYLGNGSGALRVEEVQEMVAAGWEVGSHSMSHKDLTRDHKILWYEIKHSRQVLEETIGVPVLTFAYPYAAKDTAVIDWVRNSYQAAVGVGVSNQHSIDGLYYLSRFDVRSSVDIRQFAAFLPWRDEGW